MIITTEAIILHSRKYSDTSKILVAFTRDEGKVSLIAKGARNPKSKFGGCLEPLSFSSLTIYKKANKELHTLGKAEIITPLRRLTADYDKLTTALSIAEAPVGTHPLHAHALYVASAPSLYPGKSAQCFPISGEFGQRIDRVS